MAYISDEAATLVEANMHDLERNFGPQAVILIVLALPAVAGPNTVLVSNAGSPAEVTYLLEQSLAQVKLDNN